MVSNKTSMTGSMEQFTGSPPTDDPRLPSYECPEYVKSKRLWDFLLDMYNGAQEWFVPSVGVVDQHKAEKYLPKEQKEILDDYVSRLTRSPFHRKFKDIIKGFAGLLSAFEIDNNIPQQVAQHLEDIDGLGNSLTVFLNSLDKIALRDGHVFVMVDYPPALPEEDAGKVRTILDDITARRRFWFSIIDPRDVINYEVHTENGQISIDHITIKEWLRVPQAYGSEYKQVYRVLRPGAWFLYDIVLNKATGEWAAVLLEQGATNIDKVPVIFYSLTSSDSFRSEPELMNVAELNLNLYHLISDYNSILHMCNLPLPVRKGYLTLGTATSEDEFIIGPHTLVDLPADGDFFYAEPSGTALESTRNAILDCTTAIDRVFIAVTSNEGSAKTATESIITSSATETSLFMMAMAKESATKELFDMVALYEGQQPSEGSIDVNKDIFRPPVTPEQLALLFDSSLITLKSALEQLHELGLVADVDAELSELESKAEEDMKLALKTAAGLEEDKLFNGQEDKQGENPTRAEQGGVASPKVGWPTRVQPG